LFFRYHAAQRIIVYAWVNDDDTKRAYESLADAPGEFRNVSYVADITSGDLLPEFPAD
jgi:hypothetical protein